MATKSSAGPKRTLTAFTLAMINVAAVVSLKNLPFMAEYGWAMIFYYCLAAVTMFIPTALVSAELATAWPRTGGVYIWVREAFGTSNGFLAVWLQWINNVPYFPSILAFLAGALAFTFFPALEGNRHFALAVVLIVTWGLTFINFRGMRLSGLISSVGVVAGTLVPGVLLILLAAAWLATGKTNELPFAAGELIPPLGSLSQIVLAAGVLLSFAGMEMSAVHAREVKNPQRDYPRAILFSTLIILGISVIGSLSVAVAVPKEKLGLVNGIFESFEIMFGGFGLEGLTRIVSFLIAIGVLATVSTWIIGPSKGLFATAADGELPPRFQKLNKHHVPSNVLILQATVVSVLAIVVFEFMPSVDGAFWILTALTAQVYLLMYVIMFIAAIKLRYSRPDVVRPYRVPGGIVGMWIVAGTGALAGTSGIILGFIPPQGMTVDLVFYESFLIGGLALIVLVPFVIHRMRRPDWVDDEAAMD